jgi:hypothetical protein
VPEVPAYMRRSMSSWSRDPSNSSLSGTPAGPPSAGSALQHLNRIFSSRPVDSSMRPVNIVHSGSPPEEHSCMLVPLHNRPQKQYLLGTESDMVVESVLPIILEPKLATVAESMLPSQSVMGTVETISVSESSSAEDKEADLLRALPQKYHNDVLLWFEREPFAPIDTNFPDDEDDDIVSNTAQPVQAQANPLTKLDSVQQSKRLKYKQITQVIANGPEDKSHKVSDSDVSCTAAVGGESSTAWTVNVFEAPCMSQEAIEFCMDNTFLGTTSARDLEDHLHIDTNDRVTKDDLACAWILCVASEQSDQRSFSPIIATSVVSFIEASDVEHALSFKMQRRAKLGRISLLEFLKKLEFDADGLTGVDNLLLVFGDAALESRERTKTAKNKPTSRNLRRLVSERLRSTGMRGRHSDKAS